MEIVDEFTAASVADCHWPDGLQAALEAKVARRPDGRILGFMTLQHFLRGGSAPLRMTDGRSAALAAIYGLEVACVPRPRRLRTTCSSSTAEVKDCAVVASIRAAHASARRCSCRTPCR